MRLSGWFCVVLGVAAAFAAGVFGILSLQQIPDLAAYHHARACPASAPPDAHCLRVVHGSVSAVTENPGDAKHAAHYELTVRTASTVLQLKFSTDNPMLGSAVDGDPAVVTIWYGAPVAVATRGRSELTDALKPATVRDLGNILKGASVGLVFVAAAVSARQNRRRPDLHPLAVPVLAAAVPALVLGGIFVAVGVRPSAVRLDLIAAAAALAVVLGVLAWLGISARLQTSRVEATRTQTVKVRNTRLQAATPQSARLRRNRPPINRARARTGRAAHRPPARSARTRSLMRAHPANWAPVLGPRVSRYLSAGLMAAVLIGIATTAIDGPQARAYRDAPACVGETNLATCAGDFIAVVNGVRAPAGSEVVTDVSYATDDGAINAWASFDGDPATITRLASADENAGTPLPVRVWRGSIVGAELGGTWHWAKDGPPHNTVPAIFLAASFGLLLLAGRLSIHLRAETGTRRRLLLDDLGQTAAAAGSVALLAYGFWLGALPALAVLLWLGLSTVRSPQRRA